MKIQDYFKKSSISIVRAKNKVIYSLVILILIIISLGLFVYRHNTERIIHYSLTKDIGYRSFLVEFNVSDDIMLDSPELKMIMKKEIKEVLKINHVIDAFNSDQWETVVDSDFSNEKVDGVLTLLRGTPKILPPIIAGRIFGEGEKGVAICPRHFYPNFEPREVNKNDVIDGYTLLNTDFNIVYNDYVVENHDLKKSTTYTKKFKIVGLYDSFERINDNGVCYISAEELTEIRETQISYNKLYQGIPLLNIITDDIESMKYVRNQLEKMGYENILVGSKLDIEMVNTIRSSFISVFVLILLTIIILVPIYAKRKIKREEKSMGILRACGYSKKTVKYLYIIELLNLHSIIYIFGMVIFLIVYFIAIGKIQFLINTNFMLGGLEIGTTTIIYSFLLTVILPCLITAFHINQKCNQDIIKLIGEQE